MLGKRKQFMKRTGTLKRARPDDAEGARNGTKPVFNSLARKTPLTNGPDYKGLTRTATRTAPAPSGDMTDEARIALRKVLRSKEFRDTKAAERKRGEAKQRDAVRARSGLECEFERLLPGVGWRRCCSPAGQTAHVHRRWRCGSGKYDPNVAIDGCGLCHPLYDSNLHHDIVRIPEERLLAADLVVFLATGKPPKGRPVPVGYESAA